MTKEGDDLRKWWIIAFLCLLCLGFSGCKKGSSIPFVDEIAVTRVNGDSQQTKVFTGDDMGQILNALRCLGNSFPCDVNPEELDCCMYQIRLHYTNGFEQTYCTKGERFLKEGDGVWQQAERKRIRNLHQLLEQLMDSRSFREDYTGPTENVGLFCGEIASLNRSQRLT